MHLLVALPCALLALLALLATIRPSASRAIAEVLRAAAEPLALIVRFRLEARHNNCASPRREFGPSRAGEAAAAIDQSATGGHRRSS